MINCSPLVLRVFIYPAARVSGLPAPSILRLLLSDAVFTLADLHGVSCDWELALVVARELETLNAGFVVALSDGTPFGDVAKTDPLDSLLSIPVTRFPISVRARNCLYHAQIRTIRAIVALTPERILRLKNLGRNTLNEIAGLASDLGLRLGMTDDDLLELSRLYALSKAKLHQININFLHGVDTIGCGRLSARLAGINLVGELIQIDRSSLINQLSVDELVVVEQQLTKLGIKLGTHIDEWQKESLADLAYIFAPELSCFSAVAAQYLEVELCRRIKSRGARNGAMAVSYFGLDGNPPQTLEQVGEKFAITRERVRQIVDEVRGAIGPPIPSSLRLAVNLAEKSCPCDAGEIEGELVKSGITSRPFNLESLQRIAEMFGIPPSFSVIKVGDSRLAVDSQSSALIQEILSEVRRRIGHYGVTSVQHVAKALDPTGTLKWHGLVRRFLPLLRGLNWLDDSCEWFWSPDIPRNPIVSRIKKVFMVTDKVDIEELRRALFRDPRTQEIDLPLPIFERFCHSYSTCLRVDNGTVSYASDQLDGELSESETAVFVALRDKTHALRRSDLKRICATVSDGSDATCERTISSSPIIKSLGEGYYTLVGREACPIPDIVEVPPGKTRPVVKYDLVASELAGHNSVSLFSDLSPVSESFLWNAAMRLLARAHGLGLMAADRRWSMVEVNWSSNDLAILHQWAESASTLGQRVRAAQSRALTQRQALALIFLAYCSDVARRRATEGELWPQIYAVIGERLKSELFSGDRALPRYWLQEATEDACRRFNLRHAFGREGAMGWLRTVFLQFGLTSSGLDRLPRWLSGAKLPVAVADLLEDPELGASDFRDIWTGIREYRNGSVSDAELRKLLEGSPWFSWHDVDQLVRAASEKLEWQRPEGSIDEDAEDPELFVGRLIWTGPDPSVSIEVSPRWPTDIRAQEYVVQFGSSYRGRVIQSPQGDYTLGDFRIPLTEGQFEVSLFEKGTCVVSGCSLSVLGSEDEIVFFDRSNGKQQDLWNLNLSRPIVLACRADLRVSPPAIRIRLVAQNSWVLHDFPNGCPRDLKVELEGQVLWQRPTAADEKAPSLPRAEIRLSGGRLGEFSTAEVSIGPELTPTALLIGDQMVRQSASGFKIRLVPLNYDRVKAGVFVTDGTRARKLQARVIVLNDIWGAALRKRDGVWATVSANDMLDRHDFVGSRLFLRPPRRWGGTTISADDWALMEGLSFCARSRRQGIAGLDSVLAGVGEPLRLAVGPYNSLDPGVPLALAVGDAGLIQSIAIADASYRLTCSSTVDFGPDHNLWMWQTGEQEPRKVDREYLSFDGRDVVVKVSARSMAFAMSFRGHRLGSRFVENRSINELERLLVPERWGQIVAWTRWWQIPLLHPQLKDLTAICVDKARLATFLTWVAHTGFANMSYSDETIGSSGWGMAVREFFWGWQPDEAQAAEVLRATKLLTGLPERDLTEGWFGSEELASVNPVLLVAIAARGVPSLYPNISDNERRLIWAMFANIVAGLPRESGALSATKTELFERAVRELGADSAFVRRVLWNEALNLYYGRTAHTRNLRVATGVQPFRRWLILELLDFLGKLK